MITSNNKRIFKNTGLLFFRHFILTIAGFLSIRILLNTLGIEDYGLYSVVFGLVSFTSFLSAGMFKSTQRYIAFSLGKKDQKSLQKIYSINLIIYAALSVVIFLILETLGLWFIKNILTISQDKIKIALVVYQLLIFSFISSLFITPFAAIITAHENMSVFSYISLVEAFLKLGSAIALTIAPSEKLILYAIFILIASVITTLIYIIVCKKIYPKFNFKISSIDKNTFMKIISFSGWSIFGEFTTIAKNQGVIILLNQFFNPAIVASRVIASSLGSQALSFAFNFNTGLNPPIIKTYSANKKKDMFSLITWGSKLSFFMTWIIVLPLFLEMEIFINFWLVTPPPEIIFFSKLALIETLIMSTTLPFQSATRAHGRVKEYELSLGSIQLLIFFISLGLFIVGFPAVSVFIIAIFASIVMFLIRIYIVNFLIGFKISVFLKDIMLPIVKVVFVSTFISLIAKSLISGGVSNSLFLILFHLLTSVFVIFYFGFDKKTRYDILYTCFNILKKFIFNN